MQDFEGYGSLGTDYNYDNRNQPAEVAYIWNSVQATGLSTNFQTTVDELFPNLALRIQLTNYVWKQTGPFADNSIYQQESTSKTAYIA